MLCVCVFSGYCLPSVLFLNALLLVVFSVPTINIPFSFLFPIPSSLLPWLLYFPLVYHVLTFSDDILSDLQESFAVWQAANNDGVRSCDRSNYEAS